MVYAREIDGRTLTLAVSGKLLMNGLVMYDRETDSLWSQVSGEAIYGSYEGTKLEILPALLTTWRLWLDEYPGTKTLDKRGNDQYRFDPYEPYYRDNSVGLFGRTIIDERVAAKELVSGVELDNQAKAYPFSALSDSPPVNDELAGTPLLVVFDSEGESATVFSRVVDGRALTFELRQDVLTDIETGSAWSGVTGQGLSGPLAGKIVSRIPSITLFWFAWVDFHPNTEVYGN